MKQRVAILGASEKPERYANQAFKMLVSYGHEPIPVSPRLKTLEGKKVFASLSEIEGKVDTLTMYVGEETSAKISSEILALKPNRVIFNPGSENPALVLELRRAGIEVVEGCTLVMLRTNQF